MKNRMRRIVVLLFAAFIVVFCGKILIKKAYPLHYFDYVQRYSREYKLDPYLVAAVIKSESNFNVNAKSHKDAHGLMQITEETGLWIAEQMKISNFQVNMLYEPEINIMMGCWYLDNLRQEFNGNMDLTLAAYNAGRGNVNNWLQSQGSSKDGDSLKYIPFKETDKYVKKVKVSYNMYRYIYTRRK